MVVWTPENESKLLLAIFQTQKIDKKALLDVCQKEIDPDMNEKALSNKMMRMKQAAEKKGGSPLKKMTGANDSPKSASPATPKMKKKSTAGKGSASTSYKRELTMDSDGYNADESEARETSSKKLKGEVVVKDEEEEYESPSERFQAASMTPEA